jgi:hypothetical protein
MLRAAALVAILFLVSSCGTPTREEAVGLSDEYSSYEVGVGNESCWTGHDLRVEETADTVVVELIAHRRTDVDFCEAEGVFYDHTVTLEEPLGGRVVMDATSREPVAMRD